MPALNFYMRDLYGKGFVDSRSITLPEAEDQNTLVDDQELADRNPVNEDPMVSRNILVGGGFIVVIIILFSLGGGD